MGKIYFMIFWIPAAASAVSLWIAWGSGILRRPIVLLTWFVVAFVLQFIASLFSPAWATSWLGDPSDTANKINA